MSDLEKTQSRSGAHSQVEDVNANILAQADAPINYDVDGIKGIVRSPYVLGAALLASFGGFSFGYDQGVISIILVMPQFHDQFPETSPDHPRYGFNTGFMTGMLEFGAFIGCLFLPYLADKISRKWALTIATFFFCVGAIIQTAAHNYGTLVAGRTIGGIGVGTLAMGAPLYISEIAPPNLRGSLLVLESISIVIGAIVAYWITFGTRSISGEWAFRLPFALQMAPALMVGLGIHFFPFSPRWLAMVGRDEDSLGALTKLRRVPVSDERVQAEWKGILSEVRFQQAMVARDHPSTNAFTAELAQWADLFRPRYLKPTTIALAIPFFQQFSGINAFVYYAPTFFAALGQKGDMPLILSGMVNICQLIAGIPTFLFLDQVGRRKLAIGGGFAMAVPHLIMAGVVGKFNSSWDEHPAMGWLGVALIYIYVLCYATSYGPLAWTLPAEIFPNSKRAKGVGAATAIIWLANFIIGVCVPEMLIKIGWGTYLFFGCFCVAAGVFSFFMVPETAHKSLEQISALFGDHSVAEEQDIRRRIVEEIWTDPKYQVSSDGETPCSGCKKSESHCVRVSNRFRFKRMVASEKKYSFDVNQPWLHASASGDTQKPLAIVDESSKALKSKPIPPPPNPNQPTFEPSITVAQPKAADQLTAAAEALQSFSQGGPSTQSESSSIATKLSPNAQARSHQSSPAEAEIFDIGLGGGTQISNGTADSSHGHASFFNFQPVATPSSSISTPYTSISAPSPSVPRSIPEGWSRAIVNGRPRRPSLLSQYQSPVFEDPNAESQSVAGSISETPQLGLQEGCLIRCFIENLAAAFDTTDRDRHYVLVVPQRAVYNPLLMYAICTAAARYLTQLWSNKGPNQVIEYHGIPLPNLNKESAIHYHNKCISYLMGTSTDPAHPCNDDALTAITILRYHEQVDSHLTGSDSETYVSAVQAVFHAQQEDTIGLFSIVYHPPRGADIYAPSMPSLRHSATLIALRQEIWSVLLYRRPFRLPLYGAEDCSQFEPDMVADDFDWANRILVWCAYVLKFCFGTSSDNTIDSEDPKSRVEQWNALKAFEHNWDEHLPPHYKPLAYQERNPEKGDYFPIIWHANDCQVLALQHIELTRIMLAVHSVKNQRLGIGAQAANQAFEELLRDATRKICGLALSNHRDQPAMVTAGVGISLCGEYFHDEGEQQAIVGFMANLESLHAWPTSSVVDALKTAWGTK
ncbi:Sugar transport protein MST2 [Colletotrichum gloeosporioides]|uniref:Sugar transport protein MST2 n=1 Tax=Colletotrichum gloeosporioides TaxID=474922 RepID=A0A8H4FQH2_COLGL|nr:Sugar transport protein MST2 [Colletotrichum gloeosporioides]KAF3809464.1 Sugar transport protein MST2 [Colletotrichum gloeosporioides]